ncbi:MAG: AraC family transcriptional regulator [Cyanobacteria bacterium P01_H01_bin.105]
MTLELTESALNHLMDQAHEKGELIHQPLDLGYRFNMPQQIGQGYGHVFTLRDSLSIEIRNGYLQQPMTLHKRHGALFPITAKFYLSGSSRVKTQQVPGVAPDYEEIAGHNYLYHLPDLTETEEWHSEQPLQMVMISANADYFQGLHIADGALPNPLQRMMQDTRRFHQSLGKITAVMTQVLQQILHCPYQGAAQQLYLESKAMELFALQLGQLETDSATAKPILLKPSDIERVQDAQQILEQQLCNPPSLPALARQVGLNECTLKRGFRQLLNTTVFGYLRDCRMQQAQKLLLASHITIAQVAIQVGYRNPEAFSTAFRRQFAISPKAYQLRHRCQTFDPQ